MNDTIVIYKKTKAEVNQILTEHNFLLFDNSYNYLIGMKIHKFTLEDLEKLRKQKDELSRQLSELGKKTAKDLWRDDLKEFEAKYMEYYQNWLKNYQSIVKHV